MKRLVCCVLTMVGCVLPAWGQVAGGLALPEQPGNTIPYGGSEVFRFALHRKGLEPINDPSAALLVPHETIIVVFGDTPAVPGTRSGELREFIKRGGALLVATDSSTRVPGLGRASFLNEFGIVVTGSHLTANPRQCYRGNEGQPFVVPRPGGGAPDSPYKVMENVEAVGRNAIATDHPSEMLAREPAGFLLKVLAEYPLGTRRIDVPRPVRSDFAVSLEVKQAGITTGPGRVIVLADHSVFVNGMMGFERDDSVPEGYRFDNANWRFANQTIDWMKGGFDKPRSKCVFIEDGEVIDKFAIPVVQMPPPPIPDIPPDVLANILLNHSNGLINELQEKNFLNRTLEQWFGLPRLLRWFLVIVTVFFILQCLRFLARGHRKVEPTATLTPGVQAGLQPRGGIMRQRTAAQIEVGNLYEAAGRRVRERFDVLGGQPGATGEMPPILTALDVTDGPIIEQSVRRLWRIGYGMDPLTVPVNDWDRINAMLERLTDRAARGDWSFGQAMG